MANSRAMAVFIEVRWLSDGVVTVMIMIIVVFVTTVQIEMWIRVCFAMIRHFKNSI